LAKIASDRSEVDTLIRELDGLKQENYSAEDEQMKVIEQISIVERDVAVASGELAGLRQQSSVDDQVNLNLRKEISYQEGLVTEQKECSHDAYKELTSLRECGLGLDKELDTQHKRVSILRTEIENNDQRIGNIQELLMSKEEAIAKTSMKISECHQIIQEQKYTLNKLDGELGYFET
jgi:chromosome segregation ATPase